MSDAARELQAVLGRKRPAQGVAARDFRQPRRMSRARLSELRVRLEQELPALERKLAGASGLRFTVALGTLVEADAGTLFAGRSEPLCVLRFRCGPAPAWALWDSAAAAGTLEAILGSKAAPTGARRLSPTEARLATQVLSEVVRGATTPLGLAPVDFALVQTASELGDWREAGPEAEPHRLGIELRIGRGQDSSTLWLYLAGVEARGASDTSALEALPAHLEHVEVELSASLPGCELSLDQLLALEEGDVLPLDARLGDPTTLSFEGLTLAQARLGSHRGRLAVRIEHLDVQPELA